MAKVSLAMVQFHSILQNAAVNVERIIQFMREASGRKARLIVFPELCISGYSLAIGREYYKLGEGLAGRHVQQLCQAAKMYQLHAVIPMPLIKDQMLYNSAVLIDSNGRIAGDYSKTHLWGEEKNFFQAGSDYPVYDLDFGKLGVMICYDAGFPEVARMLALKGAELIVVPAAFSPLHKKRWDIYFQARALENSCFVAGINGVDGQHEMLFGNNKLFGPQGDLLVEGSVQQEEMQIAEFDLTEVAKCRADHSYLSQLRLATYSEYKDKAE